MKIVQLITAFQLGGAEKVALDIATKMNDANLKMEFLSIFKAEGDFSDSFKKILAENDISYREIGFTKQTSKLKYFSLVYSAFFLFLYICKNKIKIVHSHTDLPDFVLAITLKLNNLLQRTRFKVVRTIHNTELWPTHLKVGKFTEKSFIDDYVVFISNDVEKAYKKLRAKYDLNESIYQYKILNGVDLNKFKNESYKLEKLNIHLDNNKINFLFVGRFVMQKGFDLLIETFDNLDSKYKDKLSLYAFGSGDLKNMAINKSFIHLYEPITDIYKIYSSFDYLVMPSRFEGLPLVSLEASASKLVVIASDAPGLCETIPPNWPLLFKNENINSFREKIIEAIDNKYDKETLGNKSFSFIAEHFNIKTTIQRYKTLYLNLEKS
ncbi:MAG TPA: glycosyltransferase [Flavobacteriia bacterium]|nr:glycosyltransferase [Flavobacteriia bacterium]